MAQIRKIEINNFRGIRNLTWLPSVGINCLIGPGDSGKSTILNAIDLCLGARRNVQFTDSDFFELNVEEPIAINITIGDLDDSLKNIDAYGIFLRGFDASTGEVSNEPEATQETVLTIKLTAASDLEPQWMLVSERAAAQGNVRSLNWADRVALSPTRLGSGAEHNLSWKKGSLLNKVSDESVSSAGTLIAAARQARTNFAEEAKAELAETLKLVTKAAVEMGVPIGDEATAMLDINSISYSGGTVSLHDESGTPLRCFGLSPVLKTPS